MPDTRKYTCNPCGLPSEIKAIRELQLETKDQTHPAVISRNEKRMYAAVRRGHLEAWVPVLWPAIDFNQVRSLAAI